MKYIPFIISLFILLSNSIFAQKENIFTELNKKSKKGEVHIYQDAEIQLLLNDYSAKKKDEKGMKGYRVQVFFGSGHTARENANNIRNQFVAKYKNIPVHVIFEEPNFKVRVGDYRTKSEALEVLVKIRENYQGAYIVSDFIELPRLEE